MLLGGLWHGAAWNFVIWGFLHGVYLSINHLYQKFFGKQESGYVITFLHTFITFIAVSFAWIFFRSKSFQYSINTVKGSLGFHGFGDISAFAPEFLILLGIVVIVVFLFPNTLEICHYKLENKSKLIGTWAPTYLWSVIITGIAIISLILFSSETEFIYYQF